MFLIFANWKMNPGTLKEAKKIFQEIEKGFSYKKSRELILCPPLLYFPYLKANQKSKIHWGAQNCFWEKRGAFTGEISPQMLKDLGFQYVILGHSERRIYFKESDQDINKKLKAVLKLKMIPVLCFGETKKERKEGNTKKVIENQLLGALEGLSQNEVAKIIFAYEPVWAVFGDEWCEAKEVLKIRELVEDILEQNFKRKFGQISFIYGGSVDSKNAKEYLVPDKIQGVLVGAASLKPSELLEILKIFSS
jgi:triosephosphate isomerase